MRKKANTQAEIKPLFFKGDLLRSKRFADKRDILNVVLKADMPYSMEQVEKLIDMFLKSKEVK